MKKSIVIFLIKSIIISFIFIEISISQVTSDSVVELKQIKPDFMVNSTGGEYGANQYNVTAAIGGEGNYALTWVDNRNGKEEIFAQFYDNNNNKIGSNIKVVDQSFLSNNTPLISANEKGDFIIVWEQPNDGVYAQKFTNNGTREGSIIKINSTYSYYILQPSVVLNDDGSFLVLWQSQVSNSYKVLIRLFDSLGNSATGEIQVNEENHYSNGSTSIKSVSADSNGNHFIVWSSNSSSTGSNIFLQVIDKLGRKIGSNMIVNNVNDSTLSSYPEIASTKDGHFLITWNSYKVNYSDSEIRSKIYSFNNGFTDEIILIENEYSISEFSTSSDRNNNFYILFYFGNTPMMRIVEKSGKLGQIKPLSINTNYNGSFSSGMITYLLNNRLIMAFNYYRMNDFDIFFQKYNLYLNPVDTAIKVNDDFGSSNQSKPLVKFNNKGESIILWSDNRNGRNDLYARLFNKDFEPEGDEMMLNFAYNYWVLYDKQVYTLSDGSFILVFSGLEDGINNIYMQKVIPFSGEQGMIKLNINNPDNYTNKIIAAINSNDEILICWYNNYEIHRRIYDKNLNPLTSDLIIQSNRNETIYFKEVTVDSKFNILTSWNKYNSSYTDNRIYSRFFNKNGEPTSDILILSDNNGYASILLKNYEKNILALSRLSNRISLKRFYNLEKNYSMESSIISYNYYSDETSILDFNNQKMLIKSNSSQDVIAYYIDDNSRGSKSYLIHRYESVGFNPQWTGNSADIFEGKLLFAFENNKNGGTGFDIWANVKEIENFDFEKEEFFFAPQNSDFIYTNYPNPFNPKTKIVYEILAYVKVKLTVYDILGREVKVLVDDYREKGLHEVEFDASGLASGIYFYRLDAFDTSVKKMIYLK